MNRTAKTTATRWVCSLIFCLSAAASANAAQLEAPYTLATRYNVGGQVTGTIAPDPDGGGPLKYLATRYTYGTAGATRGLLLRVESGELNAWLDESVDPASWDGYGFAAYLTAEFTYDGYGRKASESLIGSDGVTTESLVQYSYDDADHVRCKAVRMNKNAYGSAPASACDPGAEGSSGPDRIFRYTYDRFDQVLTEERAVGTSLAQTHVTNTYAGRGVLTSQTDANDNRTELRYDALWRLTRRVYPSPTTSGAVNESDYNEYLRDNNGNVITERKRNGTTITNTYDDNNRLIFKNLSNNTYSADVSYDYDLRGLTLSSRFGSDAGQGVANAFDGFGRLTASTTNMGGVSRGLSYGYDDDGNRTRVTHPDGYFFAYGFDGLDRVISLGESTSATPSAGTSSLLALSYRPSGSRLNLTRTGGATTTIGLDNALRMGSFTQNFAGATNDLTNTFQYNPAGQITTLSQSNTQYTYTGTETRAGSYVPNGLNQYASIGGQAITYDTNGNLTGDGSLTYTYDMENRLVATAGAQASSFIYDPLGRLFQVTIGGTTTQFLYDGDALVAEYTGGTLTRRYIHGDQVDEPWVQYDGAAVGASSRRYLYADHQGSIIAHSDSSGTVLNRLAYDAYGIPASGNTDRFGYTGQAWLKELGLFHYKARMYAPKLGRFLQTDPVFYADDFNLYAYVGNDPLNRVDPTGREGACLYAASGCDYGFGLREAGLVADFTPGVGDVKGVVEAIQNPSAVNVISAGIGLVPIVGDAAGKAIKTGANILENAAKGAKAEAQVAAKLGDQLAGRRVTLESTTGQRSVVDMVTKDKTAVEVKSGGATLSPGQKAVQSDIDADRQVIPRGQNAERAGFEPGKPVQMNCYRVERCP